jgi:hypothetical protein
MERVVRHRSLWLVALALACGGGDPEPTASRAPLHHKADAQSSNQAPEIESVDLEPSEPTPEDRIRAVVRVVDPDADPIELGFSWTLDGRRVPGDGPEIQLPAAHKGQTVRVAVTADDGQAQSRTLQAEVSIANRPPEVLGLQMEPSSSVAAGDRVAVTAKTHDPDDDRLELEYAWSVNGRPVEGEGASFSTEGLERGARVVVEVRASDGTDRSSAVQSAAVRIANAAPRIVSLPSQDWVNGAFQYCIEAEDPDGDRRLRYRLLKGPDGMTVDPVLGDVRWKPAADQAGTHPIDLVVEDPDGAASAQSFEITVREVESDSDSPASFSD